MSAEATVKKRGRPKKVLPGPVDVEVRATARPTSSKASDTPAKRKTTTTLATPAAITTTPAAKAPVKTAAAQKMTSKPSSPTPIPQTADSKAAAKPSRPPVETTSAQNASPKSPSSPPILQEVESKAAAPQTTPTPSSPIIPVTPETSKILSQVRELSAKTAQPPQAIEAAKPSPKTTPSPSTSKPNPAPPSPPPKTPQAPPPSSSSPPSRSPKPSKLPLRSMNSEIVSNITSRAGAKPNTGGANPLPANYKPTARKVTMAIVAMPIVIVTSYFLYDRLVLGNERKILRQSASSGMVGSTPLVEPSIVEPAKSKKGKEIMENTQIPKPEAARSEIEEEQPRIEDMVRRTSISSPSTTSNDREEPQDIVSPHPSHLTNPSSPSNHKRPETANTNLHDMKNRHSQNQPTHQRTSRSPPHHLSPLPSPSRPPYYQIHNTHSTKPHPYTIRPSSSSTFASSYGNEKLSHDLEAFRTTSAPPPFYSALSLKTLSRRRTCKLVFLALWIAALIAMVVLGLGFTVGKWGQRTQHCALVPGYIEGGGDGGWV
ncbi:hypothetical protein B7494_g3522 [Chlorociboria aeruginascens]|nr:hypothetical protein B7494_g3522 [Chlorociboria aeruginascens]